MKICSREGANYWLGIGCGVTALLCLVPLTIVAVADPGAEVGTPLLLLLVVLSLVPLAISLVLFVGSYCGWRLFAHRVQGCVCQRCGETVHSWIDGVCRVCGEECEHPNIHTYSGGCPENEVCAVCGKTIGEWG